MAIVDEYVVVKSFHYDGTDYSSGDVWEPGGYRHDKSLIAHRFVRARQRPVTSTAADVDELVDNHTAKELREMCKERDLPVYGTKDELAARLVGGE